MNPQRTCPHCGVQISLLRKLIVGPVIWTDCQKCHGVISEPMWALVANPLTYAVPAALLISLPTGIIVFAVAMPVAAITFWRAPLKAEFPLMPPGKAARSPQPTVAQQSKDPQEAEMTPTMH